MKYALKKPISIGEGPTLTELVFREEVVSGDLRGIKLRSLEDPATEDMLKIAGRLCAQPDVVMNKLSMEDLGGVLEVIGGFLSGGRMTGTAS